MKPTDDQDQDQDDQDQEEGADIITPTKPQLTPEQWRMVAQVIANILAEHRMVWEAKQKPAE